MGDFTPQPIKLQGKEYLEVNQRVYWLRQDHPDAKITTHLLTHNEAEGYALFMAMVEIPSIGTLATGHGSAKRSDLRGPVAINYLEKAETKAIGRACAGAGYGTLAALEEDGDTLADTPVERAPGRAERPATTPQPSEAAPVTPGDRERTVQAADGRQPAIAMSNGAGALSDKQLKAIYAIARAARHMSEPEVDARATELYGRPVPQLTRAEASLFIDNLKAA